MYRDSYDEQATLEGNQKVEILSKSLNEYHRQRSKFIQNLIKHRLLEQQSIKLRRDHIEAILWKNEALFGERLRQEFWNERMEIAVRLSSGYRGNIHQYLQTCKSLREKYLLLKEKALEHLVESKELRFVMLEEVDQNTMNLLDDLYKQDQVLDIVIDDDSLSNSTSVGHQPSYEVDILDSKVISHRITCIKQRFEDDIANILKHHEKWKANHIRRMLKDSLLGRAMKLQPGSAASNFLSSPSSSAAAAAAAASHEEKLLDYQMNSMDESKKFVKHIVDVLERCVNMIHKNSEKKAAQYRKMMQEMKSLSSTRDIEGLKRVHYQVSCSPICFWPC
jgi:hypothetical protein